MNEFGLDRAKEDRPLEILLSMTIKLGVIAAPGIPAVAVLVFQVLLYATLRGESRMPGRQR